MSAEPSHSSVIAPHVAADRSHGGESTALSNPDHPPPDADGQHNHLPQYQSAKRKLELTDYDDSPSKRSCTGDGVQTLGLLENDKSTATLDPLSGEPANPSSEEEAQIQLYKLRTTGMYCAFDSS